MAEGTPVSGSDTNVAQWMPEMAEVMPGSISDNTWAECMPMSEFVRCVTFDSDCLGSQLGGLPGTAY